MQKFLIYIFFLTIVFLLFSCENTSTAPEGFTLNVFLDEQIRQLEQTRPEVLKKASVEEKTENQTLKNLNWNKELDLFRQTDVLRPSLINRYTQQQMPHSKIFTLKAGENLPVQTLTLTYDQDSTQITRLEAFVKQENYLYKTERHLQMDLTKLPSGKMQLQTYSISGKRKLVFASETTYSVQANLKP
jgi:hypothetical protein